MNDDIFESVSQRGRGEETAENSRIHEVADELRRRCQLYEAQFRDGQCNVSRLDVEQRVAEQYAKENGIWIPINMKNKISFLLDFLLVSKKTTIFALVYLNVIDLISPCYEK